MKDDKGVCTFTQKPGRLHIFFIKCSNFSIFFLFFFFKEIRRSITNWPWVCLLNEACWGMDESLPCSGFLGQVCMMGALSPRCVPGGSWERESPARPRQRSLSCSSGHRHCHWGLDTGTSDPQIGHAPSAIAYFIYFLSFDCHFQVRLATNFSKTRRGKFTLKLTKQHHSIRL